MLNGRCTRATWSSAFSTCLIWRVGYGSVWVYEICDVLVVLYGSIMFSLFPYSFDLVQCLSKCAFIPFMFFENITFIIYIFIHIHTQKHRKGTYCIFLLTKKLSVIYLLVMF